MNKAGFSDREIQTGMEKVAVLAGDRKTALSSRAVRLGELRDRVREIIAGYETRREEEQFPNGKRLGAFKDASLDAGFYNWRTGQTNDPPPQGYAGSALLMKRKDGSGTWIASDNTGAAGQGTNRLFTRSTSGAPNDWNAAWSEIFLRDNILGSVIAGSDGTPTGSLFEVVQNDNGTALVFAAGFQLCYATGQTVAFGTAASLTTTWTFPREFSGGPVAFIIAPIVGFGTYTGITPSDLGPALSGPGLASTLIGFRKAFGAADFAAGDSVTMCQLLAFGPA